MSAKTRSPAPTPRMTSAHISARPARLIAMRSVYTRNAVSAPAVSSPRETSTPP
ncbi:MAG: hypothetical protein QM704_03895 [Anaeromyxobacteraceae bacterium]